MWEGGRRDRRRRVSGREGVGGRRIEGGRVGERVGGREGRRGRERS